MNHYILSLFNHNMINLFNYLTIICKLNYIRLCTIFHYQIKHTNQYHYMLIEFHYQYIILTIFH